MKHFYSFVFVAFTVLIIAGCATTQTAQGPFFEVPHTAPPKGYARLYIFRPYDPGSSSINPMVSINHAPIVKLTDGNYTKVTLAPGHYTIRAVVKGLLNIGHAFNRSAHLDARAGRTYYLGLITHSRQTTSLTPIFGAGGRVSYLSTQPQTVVTAERFILVSRAQAIRSIGTTRYIAPRVQVLR